MAELTGHSPPSSLLPPTRRGPMYSAYAELREWKLRSKKAGMSSPIPAPTKRGSASPMIARSVPDFSMAFRKENKKPPPGPRSDMSMTPPPQPMSLKSAGQKRVGSATVRKSYSCLKELKEFSLVAGASIEEEGRSGGKGVLKSFRRQTSTTTTAWMA